MFRSSGEATGGVESGAHRRRKYNIAVVLVSEKEPSGEPGAENIPEEKRIPAMMKGCPKPGPPATRRARRERGDSRESQHGWPRAADQAAAENDTETDTS